MGLSAKGCPGEAVVPVGRTVPREGWSQPKRGRNDRCHTAADPTAGHTVDGHASEEPEMLAAPVKGVEFLCESVGPGTGGFASRNNHGTLENVEITRFLHISKLLNRPGREGGC